MELLAKKPKSSSKDNNKHQSSVDLPIELVVEILLRLHIKTLFKYKCVSKQWRSTISDPRFARNYMQRAVSSTNVNSSFPWRLWGILPRLTKGYYENSSPKSLVCPIHDEPDDEPPSLYVGDSHDLYDTIVGSSNGLILHIYYRELGPVRKLCVMNPLTKQSVEIPFPRNSPSTFRLATGAGDENTSTYITYKVVSIQEMSPRVRYDKKISVFSSETGEWSDVKEVKCIHPDVVFEYKPVSCDGILHWFDWKKRSVVTYDPYNSPDRFGQIRLPSQIELDISDMKGFWTMNRSYYLLHLDPVELLGFGNEEDDPDSDSDPDYDPDPLWIHGLSGMHLIHLGRNEFLKFGDIEVCDYTERRLRVWRLLIDFYDGKVTGQEVFVYSSKIRAECGPVVAKSLVPVALCPWSSPFYGQPRNNSSSVVRFRKISPIWFPSSKTY